MRCRKVSGFLFQSTSANFCLYSRHCCVVLKTSPKCNYQDVLFNIEYLTNYKTSCEAFCIVKQFRDHNCGQIKSKIHDSYI